MQKYKLEVNLEINTNLKLYIIQAKIKTFIELARTISLCFNIYYGSMHVSRENFPQYFRKRGLEPNQF